MASSAKPKKIVDIEKPEAVAPTQSSSRPIIVTNHPVLTNDPMVVGATKPEGGADAAADLPSAPALSRHGKTLLMSSSEEPAESAQTPADEPAPNEAAGKESSAGIAEAAGEPKVADRPVAAAKKIAPISPDMQTGAQAEEQPEAPVAETASPAEAESDVETDEETGELSEGEQRRLVAEEAAARKADEELEQLIESGAYRLPINAVRRRSRFITLVLMVFILLLAVVLADLLLDVGLVHFQGVPHTAFFQRK